ncbi:MAG: thiamine phosphate synthase [Pontixanthobacter sp.]
MAQDQTSAPSTLPGLWLLSDARNDDRLEDALSALPRGSGFVFRHYHLATMERRKRFDVLHVIAQRYDHTVILSDDGSLARRWGADGIYGPPGRIVGAGAMPKLATAHNWPEIVAANRAGADGVFLSPVFATRSHTKAKPLGNVRFRMLAAKSAAPVIALGGMNAARARQLGWPRWGAIDGLS